MQPNVSFITDSDNYINFNLNSLCLEHFSNKNPITLTIVKKINGNISLNNNLKIKFYSPKKDKPNLNYVELGYIIVDKKVNNMINFLNLVSDL